MARLLELDDKRVGYKPYENGGAIYEVLAASPLKYPMWKFDAAHIGTHTCKVEDNEVELMLLRLPRWRAHLSGRT
jgi:hypothetical protein